MLILGPHSFSSLRDRDGKQRCVMLVLSVSMATGITGIRRGHAAGETGNVPPQKSTSRETCFLLLCLGLSLSITSSVLDRPCCHFLMHYHQLYPPFQFSSSLFAWHITATRQFKALYILKTPVTNCETSSKHILSTAFWIRCSCLDFFFVCFRQTYEEINVTKDEHE